MEHSLSQFTPSEPGQVLVDMGFIELINLAVTIEDLGLTVIPSRFLMTTTAVRLELTLAYTDETTFSGVRSEERVITGPAPPEGEPFRFEVEGVSMAIQNGLLTYIPICNEEAIQVIAPCVTMVDQKLLRLDAEFAMRNLSPAAKATVCRKTEQYWDWTIPDRRHLPLLVELPSLFRLDIEDVLPDASCYATPYLSVVLGREDASPQDFVDYFQERWERELWFPEGITYLAQPMPKPRPKRPVWLPEGVEWEPNREFEQALFQTLLGGLPDGERQAIEG